MELVTSVISQFPETKDQKDLFVSKLIAEVLSGSVDHIRVSMQLENMKSSIDQYFKDERIRKYEYAKAEEYLRNHPELYDF
jgi:hypothetical protein